MAGATRVCVLVTSCPLNGEVKVSKCMSCPHFRGLKGSWPHVKITCDLSPAKPLKTEILVACPIKRHHISFKTCLKCPLHRGFYGFHDNNPVVYCSVLTGEEDRTRRPLYAPLLLMR